MDKSEQLLNILIAKNIINGDKATEIKAEILKTKGDLGSFLISSKILLLIL